MNQKVKNKIRISSYKYSDNRSSRMVKLINSNVIIQLLQSVILKQIY